MTEFLKNIVAKTAKPTITAPKSANKEEALKQILLKGLDTQLYYIDLELADEKLPFRAKRWYALTDDKETYYCFIKYQNKPIPFLENNATAYIADSLEEVKDIYKEIRKEIKSNPEFIKHLDNKIKTMKIAKGVATKKG